MAESVYDHPFQWGSKRTGPDLAREGGKYPNLWHYRHMIDPREVSPGSDHAAVPGARDRQGRRVEDGRQDARAALDRRAVRGQGDRVGARPTRRRRAPRSPTNLRKDGAEVDPSSEIVALIAYLQRLGVHPEPAAERRPRPSVAREVRR